MPQAIDAETTLRVQRPRGHPQVNQNDRCLMVLSGHQAGQVFDISNDSMTIGRSEAADIIVDETSVSRAHARLEWCGERELRIVDLGSTNGTWVDGQCVADRVLEGGERIELGSAAVLRFGFHDPDEHHFFRRLYQHATLDDLTGVCNRRGFHEHLDREIAWHRRHNRALALALFDVDRFKDVNDSFGHLVGDVVLRGVAGTLKQQCRTEDLVARIGGDEFVCVLRQTATQDGLVVAERARAMIAHQLFGPDGPTGSLTFKTSVSVGLAAQRGPNLTSAEALVAAADRGLYAAKEAGRNRVGYVIPTPDGAVVNVVGRLTD